MGPWMVVIGVAVGSYALRAVPMVILGRVRLSGRVEDVIARAGLAALAAFIAVSTRAAATGPATVPTLGAVAVGTVLAFRQATMVRIVTGGGVAYGLVRLATLLW